MDFDLFSNNNVNNVRDNWRELEFTEEEKMN